MIQFDEIAAFDTANLGAVARAPLPVGRRTYHGIVLQPEGVSAYATGGSAGLLDARHAIEYAEIFVSGKSKSLLKPWPQFCHAQFQNVTADLLPNHTMFIPLSRPGYQESDWATGDMESLQLAVKIRSSLPTGTGGNAALSRLKAWAIFEELPAPVPRGNVFTQNVVTPNTPVAGWNTIDNLTVGSLARLSRLLFVAPISGTNLSNSAATAISQVKVSIGGRYIFNATRTAIETALAHSPIYRSAMLSATNLDALNYSTPVFLNRSFDPLDFPELVEGNVRQPVKVEYYWDTGVAAVTPIDILVEGIELGVSRPTVAAQ